MFQLELKNLVKFSFKKQELIILCLTVVSIFQELGGMATAFKQSLLVTVCIQSHAIWVLFWFSRYDFNTS